MAGGKKRATGALQQRPHKKQKRQKEYHSDSESEGDDEQAFEAVDLLDSDDCDEDAAVEEAPTSEDDHSSSSEDIASNESHSPPISSKPGLESDDEHSDESASDDGDDSDSKAGTRRKSKRNDPQAFATSISKILSTKLSTSRRADPVLSRSAAAHEASKAAVDSALEAKARRHLREQKKRASEKGRVKDVLVASNNETGEGSTGEVLEVERRLRKVAQRGVVKLFNAVRAAQVKAVEAEKDARKEGIIGINNRETKVNEMSKKGFLDLIASGGGGLRKGGLEEA